MAKVTGFMEYHRQPQPYRPVEVRLRDWQEVMQSWRANELNQQAARCMDCGIPFCHQGCPLGNLIPDWNDLVWRQQWQEAIQRLHATNNFPEFTGTLCPAPCEGACVLGINDEPVTIKAVELAIVDHAWEQGWVVPQPPSQDSGKQVAIVGSGPAGLAAAQQLARVGHRVTVFEQADRAGGLLRYGIPEFKMEKWRLDRRLQQMQKEGVVFRTGVHVGVDVTAQGLREEFDAVLLCVGSSVPRELDIPGRESNGIYQAMKYLPMQNRLCTGDHVPDHFISAKDKHVVIIGGGDTGADCLGTANRQQALSVHQLEIMPRLPIDRAADNPWPEWPRIFRTASAHEEGVERLYSVATQSFVADDQGCVKALQLIEVKNQNRNGRTEFIEVAGSERQLPCDLVLLALGFSGPEQTGLITDLGVRLDPRGNVATDPHTWMSSEEGIFAAGDARRGQSLIVWAIAEGRSAASAIDSWLMGRSSSLPALIQAD